MEDTGAGENNIFCQVEQIRIEDMQFQALWYFLLQGIVNVTIYVPNPLVVSALKNYQKINRRLEISMIGFTQP